MILYEALTKRPLNARLPQGTVLVKKYRKPETHGLLYLPGTDGVGEEWAYDHTHTLWEVVLCSTELDAELGFKLEEDDILTTAPRPGRDLHCVDADGERLWLMTTHSDIRGVTRWKEELMMLPIGDRIVVKADDVETQTESGLHLPSTAEQDKINRGTVFAIGPDVSAIDVGDRVCY